jgi:mannose-6-phosphate isomerase-like protein (cupin superfamily)
MMVQTRYSRIGVALLASVSLGLAPGATAGQHPAPSFHAGVEVTRIFSGPDDLTHVEVVMVTVVARAAPNQLSALSELSDASTFQIRSWAPGYSNDWHTVSERHYMIGVSGTAEVEVSAGPKVRVEPGRIFLFENLTGKGHRIRNTGSEPCVTAAIAAPKLK